VIRPIAVLAAILAIAVPGCGSDDSGEETSTPSVSIPAITSPLGTTTSAPAATVAPATTTTGKPNGGGNENKGNPNLPDSETNDVPPPPGSPQESFERQCEENPQACG